MRLREVGDRLKEVGETEETEREVGDRLREVGETEGGW